jgi:DNA polymerase-4
VPRILCARFPHLGLLAAWRRHPELRAEPVVIGGAPELRLPVVAASAAAEAAGVRPGQPLREAQQRCPAAVFVALDEAEVEALRQAVITALCGISPAVEVGDDEAFADLSGSHALHPTETAWAVATARVLTGALGDTPSVGVAGTRFVARTAAHTGTPGHVRRVREGEEAAFLAPLPLHLLPADRAVLARLATLGLDCAGAVAGLALADLQRQFGPAGLAVHRLARGLAPDPGGEGVRAWTPPRVLAERLSLDGTAIADLEAVRHGARRLTEALGARLQAAALAAGTLDLAMEQEGGGVAVAARVLPAAAGNGGELWPAVLGLLGEARPEAPVVALRLQAGQLQSGGGRQLDIWRGGDARRDAVLRGVMRLQDRFGRETVLQPRQALDPGDLPERRAAWDVPGGPQPEATPAAGTAARP